MIELDLVVLWCESLGEIGFHFVVLSCDSMWECVCAGFDCFVVREHGGVIEVDLMEHDGLIELNASYCKSIVERLWRI